MSLETEVEKLSIDERKIIDILLKQLMTIQNEFAYFKNKTRLQLPNSAFVANRDGSKKSPTGISVIEEGGKPFLSDIIVLREGSKVLLSEINVIDEGSKPFLSEKVDLRDGGKHLSGAISDLEDGSKPLSDGIRDIQDGSKGDIWLYTVFEKELIIALEQYMNNANGQNSLYGFYADFVNAVKESNKVPAPMTNEDKDLTLKETHTLPSEIIIDSVSISKLSSFLRLSMANNIPADLPRRMARELLLLHNVGKATTPQLREAAKLSEGGIQKHLPKLQRAGFIKKQPPSNYALTDKSKLILLKLFGVAKK